MTGGPCFCTSDKAYAKKSNTNCFGTTSYSLNPVVADEEVMDAVAEFSAKHPDKDSMWKIVRRYGLEGIYMNVRVITREEFIKTIAGPIALEVVDRPAGMTLEDFAEAHHMRYTEAAKYSRIGGNVDNLYYNCCHMPIKHGALELLVYYYAAILDIPNHIGTRIANVLVRNYKDLDTFLDADPVKLTLLRNIGKASVPYILKLQDAIRKAVKKEDKNESRAET
jgi:hypothetical protein